MPSTLCLDSSISIAQPRDIPIGDLAKILNEASFHILDPKRDYFFVLANNAEFLEIKLFLENLKSNILTSRDLDYMSSFCYQYSIQPKKVYPCIYVPKEQDTCERVYQRILRSRSHGKNIIYLINNSLGRLDTLDFYVRDIEIYTVDVSWALARAGLPKAAFK